MKINVNDFPESENRAKYTDLTEETLVAQGYIVNGFNYDTIAVDVHEFKARYYFAFKFGCFWIPQTDLARVFIYETGAQEKANEYGNLYN